MTERSLGRAIGVLILTALVGIALGFLIPKRQAPIPTPPPPPPPVTVQAEADEELPILRPVVVETDTARLPCDGLGESASLTCVLKSSLDLDSFSDATLQKAERAALRERLATT